MATGPRYTLLSSWLYKGRKTVRFWRERGMRDGMKAFLQCGDTQKGGELKGVDAAGNQYWEDNTTTPGRTRYMIYADTKNVNASAIPPEWHGWMHYIIDETPVDRPTALPTFHQPHQATSLSNLGASAAYLPPGHTLSKRFTPFGTSDRIEVATGEEEARPKMGSYQSWKPSNAPTPQKTRAEVETPKTERR